MRRKNTANDTRYQVPSTINKHKNKNGENEMKFQGAKTYMQNTTVMMMTVTIHTKEAQGH